MADFVFRPKARKLGYKVDDGSYDSTEVKRARKGETPDFHVESTSHRAAMRQLRDKTFGLDKDDTYRPVKHEPGPEDDETDFIGGEHHEIVSAKDYQERGKAYQKRARERRMQEIKRSLEKK